MINKSAYVLILLGCLCLLTSSQCPIFYTDFNLQGNSFQQCNSGDVPSQWNDQVSSFSVPPGFSVRLFQDYGQGGQSYGPYGPGTYNVPSEFNDQLSSVSITRSQPQPIPSPIPSPLPFPVPLPQPQPQPRPPRSNCPRFYVDYNQRGSSFQLCSSGNVPSRFNDQVSSLVVPAGYRVTLHQDYNFGGQTVGPYGPGSYNVPGYFNDQLSSVTISRVSQNNCPRFYVDYNQRGSSFQLCSSGNVPARFNDQVSSFFVPRGYTVQLYEDYGYGGRRTRVYGPGNYNVPANFNDLLSSVGIRRR